MKNNDFNNIMQILFGDLSQDIQKYSPLQEVEHYFNKLKYANTNYPPVNIYFRPSESNDKEVRSLHFEVALSGFKKEDINIKLDENRKILKIESVKKEETEDKKHYLVHKLAKREFRAEYSLPFNKIKEIHSELKDGLLTIDIIPEKENNERIIEIK